MPQKNVHKVYVENTFYHAYNRGVDEAPAGLRPGHLLPALRREQNPSEAEIASHSSPDLRPRFSAKGDKRIIYKDDQDYRVFLHLLKYYLSAKNEAINHPLENIPGYSITRVRPIKNLNKEVELHAFCLMPNHFHLLVKQITKKGMTKLMRKLLTTYAMYFNKRYDRVGYLFQGNYKAVRVKSDNYILHLSRYIHLNPTELTGSNPVSYPYSSYVYYLGKKKADWIKTSFILKYFDKSKLQPEYKATPSYQRFVETFKKDSGEILGAIIIE